MSTRIVGRKAEADARAGLARKSHQHILCRPHTALSLARALGVSVATVARVLAELRLHLAKEGAALVSVKEGASWRYEIRDPEDLWASDPLIRAVGSVQARRPRGETVDDALYGRRRRPR